jgi:hypothetical protein
MVSWSCQTEQYEEEYDDDYVAFHYGWEGGDDDAHMQRVLWDNRTASTNAHKRPASADRRSAYDRPASAYDLKNDKLAEG